MTARLRVTPHGTSCHIEVGDIPDIGAVLLWLPEGIMSAHGASSVYPTGGEWHNKDGAWIHEVEPDGLYGGGNCPRVDQTRFECCGISFPVEAPVSWRATLRPEENRLTFSITLTNRGHTIIPQAAAPVCVKFLDASWWSDARVFVRSQGAYVDLAGLGRPAGRDNGFQAYLLQGASYPHPFYEQFWGFHDCRLDLPVIVSHNQRSNTSVAVCASQAYFLHSNLHNPCTDVMAAFGDIAPGAIAQTSGHVIWWNGGLEDGLVALQESGVIQSP